MALQEQILQSLVDRAKTYDEEKYRYGGEHPTSLLYLKSNLEKTLRQVENLLKEKKNGTPL